MRAPYETELHEKQWASRWKRARQHWRRHDNGTRAQYGSHRANETKFSARRVVKVETTEVARSKISPTKEAPVLGAVLRRYPVYYREGSLLTTFLRGYFHPFPAYTGYNLHNFCSVSQSRSLVEFRQERPGIRLSE